MICITIAQESRHMVLADMLNAVQMGADLLEIRLDLIGKAPQFNDMLAAKRKPVMFSCRRQQDGAPVGRHRRRTNHGSSTGDHEQG